MDGAFVSVAVLAAAPFASATFDDSSVVVPTLTPPVAVRALFIDIVPSLLKVKASARILPSSLRHENL